MWKFATASVLTLGLGMWGCSGGDYSSGSVDNPAAPTPATSNEVVTIDVVAINGAQSFSPNPATLPAGQMVVWRNLDSVTHRIGFDDRSLDTGDIAAGTSSSPLPIVRGGPYHCRLYPVFTSGTVVVADSHP